MAELTVPAGTTYTIEAGTTEYYTSTDVDGTLNVYGSLVLRAEIGVPREVDVTGVFDTGRDVTGVFPSESVTGVFDVTQSVTARIEDSTT